MTIAFDQDYAADIGEHYGQYRATFLSDTGQVTALLFQEGDQLVAYIYFERGVTPETLTDEYLSPLKHYAAEQGFAGKLLLRYT